MSQPKPRLRRKSLPDPEGINPEGGLPGDRLTIFEAPVDDLVEGAVSSGDENGIGPLAQGALRQSSSA